MAERGLAVGVFVHLHRYGQEFLPEGEPLRGAVALQHLPEHSLDRLGLLVDRVPVQERRDLLAELAARQAQRAKKPAKAGVALTYFGGVREGLDLLRKRHDLFRPLVRLRHELGLPQARPKPTSCGNFAVSA